VFVGTGFIERQRLLEKMDWQGVDFGLYGTWGMVQDTSPLVPLLGEDREGFVINQLTAALYRKAKVGLNLHRTSVEFLETTAHVTSAESLNPRCYELAACGRFFVTDWRAELDDVFGKVLPTFKTPRKATALVRRALAEPQWRADVAGRCQERVQQHSWQARAAQALEHLQAAGIAAA
jgi:spore maturation protein CgeB